MKSTRSMTYGMIIGGFALLAGSGIGVAAAIPASGLPALPDFTGDPSLTEQVKHGHYHYRRKSRHAHGPKRHRHRYDRRRHGSRYRHRRPGYRFHFGGWWYSDPWWFYSIPRPHYGNRHIEWCLGRYRSYNRGTDMFFGYDGRYHRCRSPYRY